LRSRTQKRRAPKNIGDYIGAPDKNTYEQTESNLRELIKQRSSNIKAIAFDVGIIRNLENEIAKNRYGVQFIPGEVASYADFYLVKF
jgi:hypothetical protein